MVGDSFTFGGDGIKFDLECGHPNVLPGESCGICGKVVPTSEAADGNTQPQQSHQEGSD